LHGTEYITDLVEAEMMRRALPLRWVSRDAWEFVRRGLWCRCAMAARASEAYRLMPAGGGAMGNSCTAASADVGTSSRAAGGFVIEFRGVCYQDTYPDVS